MILESGMELYRFSRAQTKAYALGRFGPQDFGLCTD